MGGGLHTGGLGGGKSACWWWFLPQLGDFDSMEYAWWAAAGVNPFLKEA